MSYNTPEEFINAADQELMRQDWKAAWKIATEGLQHFPDHAELQKYAYILAPPKVTSVPRDPNRDVQGDIDWLKQNRDEYRGRWVGIKNGELLAVGNSHDEIISVVGPVKNTGILVTKVY
ncbi:hypothetical protein [[Phormidium] sp. ETS-05]|uniref:hypothetical protein n=1 Tax=[Phormidium] sp. ETS-05 TaxID=222819 RepID=UPI0018EEE1D5|nr:hypothetical protein [[Phormidium] sp. ETS-05]